MSVNAKEKKMLQSMWADSEAEGSSELPDGTYQFKIVAARFHMTDKGKPTFKTKIEVTGGDEDYVGQSFEINDNLETTENMGWFKRKLRRLNITVSDDFDDIIDGVIAEEMQGKVFEGQVKTKNDFMNVYVNRLLGEGALKNGKSSKKEEEEKDEDTDNKAEGTEIEEGAAVEWGNGKTGEVVELISDEGMARVRRDDGTVVRVKIDLLSLSENGTKEEEEEQEEKEEDETEHEEFDLPDADDVGDMSAGDVRKALKAIGFEPADIKDPRGVLHSFCTLAEDSKAKIELSEVAPLAAALEVTVKKGDNIKDTLKKLAKAVQDRLG